MVAGLGCGISPYLFVQSHIAFLVYLELRVVLAGSFAGTELNINIHLQEGTKSWKYVSCYLIFESYF